jgi:hypothetical protein
MKDLNSADQTPTISKTFAASAQRVLTIDVAKYEEYMRDSGMDAGQREDFLRSIWMVVVTFVELGFGVHPLQEVCGKDDKSGDQRPKDAFDRVTSKTLPNHETKNRTGPEGRLEAE